VLLSGLRNESPPRLEVNLSAESIRDAQFTSRIDAQLAQYRVPARKLVLCIPERVARAEPAAAAAIAPRVRSMGCVVARVNIGQDGEGWGTPESEQMLDLPLDYVKLDGSLVRPLPYSGEARLALHRLLTMTQSRGIETVAVFVGDEETVELLEQESVDYAQGFYVGPPESTRSTLEEIAEHAANQYATAIVTD